MALWGKRDDMVVHEAEPYNAEPPRAALADGGLTPTSSFYSRNHGPVPRRSAQDWRLRVDGLVDRPLTLSLADLQQQFDPCTLSATLQCAGNRRVGFLAVRDIPGEDPWGPAAISTAEWTGAPLAAVLAAAGVRAGAAHVAFGAPDVSRLAHPPQPYGGSIGLAKALGGEVLLAWAMNGEPLAPLHGAPVRVLVPGYVGARSVKWVDRVSVQAEPSDNYFQATAYRVLPPDADPSAAGPGDGISLGPVPLNAEFCYPDDGDRLPAGRTTVTGWAVAGDARTIARVDVSGDGGASWVQAELDEPASAWVWRRWRAELDLPAGDVELVARAWDDSGSQQPESAASLWNPKGYVNTSWPRVRVRVG